MSYAQELIKKYVEKGILTLPEGMELYEQDNIEQEEKFGVKEFFLAVFIGCGFILLVLLYFGNPETISFVRQVLK